MKKIFTLLIGIIFWVGGFAQPLIQWQKSLGGTTLDFAQVIQCTSDGGYIVAGNSWSNDGDVTGHHSSTGSSDFWLVKLNSQGTIQWQKSLGGSTYEWLYSIQQTIDAGYIIAGSSQSNDGDVTANQGSEDPWVVKTDSIGNIQWQRSGLGDSNSDYAKSVVQTADSGFVAAGTTTMGGLGNYDYWLIKFDWNGNTLWQRFLGGSNAEDAHCISNTTDGGFIVAGRSSSNDGDVTGNHISIDYWVVRLDSGGSILWQKSLGGSGEDEAYSVEQTSDGGFIVAGKSRSNDGDVTGHHGSTIVYDYWVVKLDSNGIIQWQKSLGGDAADEANSIAQTSDGGYIVSGASNSANGDVTVNHGNYDYWAVRLDNNGNIIWQRSLGGTDYDLGNSIQQTFDGGYIVAGRCQSNNGDVTPGAPHGGGDYWVVKFLFCTNTSLITSNVSPLCYGGIGSATVTATNGTPPYTYLWSNGDTVSTINGVPAATYTVTVTGNILCAASSATATVTITQPAQLAANLSSVATDVSCIGSATSATGGGVPPYNYQWSNSANTASINNLCSGWYYVTITDVNDCVIIDSVFVNFISGSNEINTHNIISLSSNPATTEIRIHNAELRIESVDIYNVLGEKVFESNKAEERINVSALRAGIYFLKVRTEKEERVAKFVKE